jgi:hypothetical protein
MKEAFIPQYIVEKLLTIDANKEQMGVLLPQLSENNSQKQIVYDKIMLRYDEHPDNDTCKLNDIVFDEVCFHTHPKVCYDIYKTDRGWPSVYDTKSFLEINKIRVLLIISIEGIYLLVKKKKDTAHLSEGAETLYKTRFKKVGKDVLTIDKFLTEINDFFGDYARMYLVERKTPGNFIISFT